MNKKYIIVFAIATFVATMVLSTQLQLGKPGEFPKQLEGLTISGVETGDEAIESIEQLYSFSSRLQMTDAYVIDYNGVNGESVSIWISRLENHDMAYQQGQYLTGIIGSMNGFTSPESVELENIPSPAVHYVEGFGSQHYYYVKKNSVYWISITNLIESDQLEIVEQIIIKID